MAKKLNVSAQRAQNVAREARKAANPKSQRAAVRAGTMTKAEAIEQATVRRAGVQAAGRRATAGRTVERGVQERAARVETRRKEERAARNAAQRPAPAQGSGAMGKIKGGIKNAFSLKGAGVAIGGNIAAGAISGDGKSRARNITATMVGDAATGYAIGRQYGAAIGATVGLVRGTVQENQRTGKATINIPTTYTPGASALYTSSGTKAAAPKKTTAASAPAASMGGSVGPRTRGGARGAQQRVAPAAKKSTAVTPAAQRKPKAAPKASSYGEASYTQHEAFRKELEAGGGRAAWNMGKQAAAGGERVEVVKSDTATTLGAELEKFQASGGKKPKRDIQIGGIAGRTGGKWHLGKKVGKG